MTPEQRIQQINDLLPALTVPALVALLKDDMTSLTHRLIGENDEQTRGRIKALRDLLNLPEALRNERDQLTAALSEESDAA